MPIRRSSRTRRTPPGFSLTAIKKALGIPTRRKTARKTTRRRKATTPRRSPWA